MAKLEWAANGGLGRTIIGKVSRLSAVVPLRLLRTRMLIIHCIEHSPHGGLGSTGPPHLRELEFERVFSNITEH